MLLLYILWDDWPIFMISSLKEQIEQQWEYTLRKPDYHSWWISKMQSRREDTLEERYAIKLCFKLVKIPQKRMKCFRLLSDHLAGIEHHFLSGIRHSRKTGSLWGMMRGAVGVRKSIHQSWLAKGLGLGLLCWGFKGVQQEIPSEEASTLQFRSVHQSTTLSLSQTIWPRWSSRQLLALFIFQTMLPEAFGYSLSSEAVVMRQLRRWKRLWRMSLTCSHKMTSMRPSRSCCNGTTNALQPGEITSKGTRVSCEYYKRAHTKKVWKLI